MEVDYLLPIVEAATTLRFIKSERGDIELTPGGRAFAEADISTRKELFRETALANVTLLQQMNGALASKSDHTMPMELFRDILEEHFSEAEVQRQLDTALNWGRYGGIFTYDSESDRLRLYPPANLAADDETAVLHE
jgi:NitT/TauT family transport system ATP-binding protein